jgi:glycine oxidase
MEQKDYLIIGQGIAGTILSYQLHKLGIRFKVIDDPQFSRSSRIAAGLANPVVLKRQKWVKGAELFTENLSRFYQEMEKDLKTNFFHPLPLYHLFQSIGEINDWQQNASKTHLQSYLGEIAKNEIANVNSPFGYAKVENIFWVDTQMMISSWRKVIKEKGALIEESFKADDYPHYKHIYCNGHLLSQQFPQFQSIFTKTKGQVMVIKSPVLCPDYGLHSSVFTLPLGNQLFKVGATYEHHNLNDETSPEGLSRLRSDLEKFYTGPYELVEHLAGVRPNIKDRKPLLGKVNDGSYCFNGLGSRGILMAPYLSEHFCKYLIYGNELNPTWDLQRFN